jgi:hypothetical protein
MAACYVVIKKLFYITRLGHNQKLKTSIMRITMKNKTKAKKTPKTGESLIRLLAFFGKPDGRWYCELTGLHLYDYCGYALMICDLVRHVARAFGVKEDDVWDWVDRERRNPTTAITGQLLGPSR